jgi:hypothetical protein
MFFVRTLGICLLLGTGLAGWVVLASRDLPDPGDGDLAVARLDLPDEQNAFTHIERAAASLAWAEDDAARENELAEILRGEKWDGVWVAKLLRSNRESLGHVADALRWQEFQVPEVLSASDDLPDMLQWQRLVKLLALRAAWHARRSEMPEAWDSALVAARLGHRIEGARGGVLIHAMIGLSTKGIGLAALRGTLPFVHPDPAAARRIIGILDGLRSDPEAWARMWSAEYRTMRGTFLAVAEASEQADEGAGDLESHDTDLIHWLLPDAYTFQPIRTLRIWGNTVRSFQRDSAVACSQMSSPVDEGALPTSVTLLTRNGTGKILMRIAAPNYRRFLIRRCLSDTAVSATQVMIALRAYQEVTGGLPESLDELVPEYLAHIPRDAFDGEAIRYRADARLLYGLGDDFRDAGGSLVAGERNFTEPSFPILF